MTERIDHAAEAQRLMAELSAMNVDTQPMAVAQKSLLITSHIGLASVEQQRIANLVALARPHKLLNGAEVLHTLHDHVTGELRSDVREAVGL